MVRYRRLFRSSGRDIWITCKASVKDLYLGMSHGYQRRDSQQSQEPKVDFLCHGIEQRAENLLKLARLIAPSPRVSRYLQQSGYKAKVCKWGPAKPTLDVQRSRLIRSANQPCMLDSPL